MHVFFFIRVREGHKSEIRWTNLFGTYISSVIWTTTKVKRGSLQQIRSWSPNMINWLDWCLKKVVILRVTINHHLTSYSSFSKKKYTIFNFNSISKINFKKIEKRVWYIPQFCYLEFIYSLLWKWLIYITLLLSNDLHILFSSNENKKKSN